jgi:hypothetical protein
VLLLSAVPALAQQSEPSALGLLGSGGLGAEPAITAPFPLVHESALGGLSFDLGDSEQRQLRLQLAEPLFISAGQQSRWLGLLGPEMTVGGSLGWLATDNLGLELSAAQTERGRPFQPLGSIHCENGVLAPDSYTASGCYFVDQPGTPSLNTLSLGANVALGDRASAAINLFQQEAVAGSALSSPGAESLNLPLAGLSGAGFWGGSVAAGMPGRSLEFLQSELSGIDLEFQVGVATDRAGEMRLGLQLTRILDGSYQAQDFDGTGLNDWTLSEPADSARLSFDWSKGAFSGGVQSYYRAPMQFMNRPGVDSMTTFDVHFTWHMPWNANLSVGASNLLNAGAEDGGAGDTALTDPFESVYGRIPYVRYQQDL